MSDCVQSRMNNNDYNPHHHNGHREDTNCDSTSEAECGPMDFSLSSTTERVPAPSPAGPGAPGTPSSTTSTWSPPPLSPPSPIPPLANTSSESSDEERVEIIVDMEREKTPGPSTTAEQGEEQAVPAPYLHPTVEEANVLHYRPEDVIALQAGVRLDLPGEPGLNLEDDVRLEARQDLARIQARPHATITTTPEAVTVVFLFPQAQLLNSDVKWSIPSILSPDQKDKLEEYNLTIPRHSRLWCTGVDTQYLQETFFSSWAQAVEACWTSNTNLILWSTVSLARLQRSANAGIRHRFQFLARITPAGVMRNKQLRTIVESQEVHHQTKHLYQSFQSTSRPRSLRFAITVVNVSATRTTPGT